MKIDDSELRDLLSINKKNSTGQYVCNCPFCGKENHFYIDSMTQLFHCKKCDETGNIYKLVNFLGKTFLLQGATVEYRETIKGIGEEEHIEESIKIEELPIRKMPVGFKIRITDYLIKRGVTEEDVKFYNIGYSELLEKYKDYILIPIYDNGKIRGFLGRYNSKIVPNDMLRYNNSRGTDFSKLLFGFDEIVEGETITVIIVEGVFDKIAVDKILKLRKSNEIKCVCTFGKKISDYQIEKLKSKFVYRVIMLYDFDAISEIKKISFKLEKHFFTNIIFTEHKDIDECPMDEALEVFNRMYNPRDFYNNVIGKVKM